MTNCSVEGQSFISEVPFCSADIPLSAGSGTFQSQNNRTGNWKVPRTLRQECLRYGIENLRGRWPAPPVLPFSFAVGSSQQDRERTALKHVFWNRAGRL